MSYVAGATAATPPARRTRWPAQCHSLWGRLLVPPCSPELLCSVCPLMSEPGLAGLQPTP